MLLNPYNCFHIDGVGIYVYFPELNRLFFYEQKKDKDFVINDIINTIETPTTIKNETSIVTFEGIVNKKTVKLYLQPFFKLNQFQAYFEKNFKEPKENKIDFFVMNKFTKKTFLGIPLNSPKEPRIVCINYNDKLIRYYGPDNNGIKVYDVIVPYPIPEDKPTDGIQYIYEINKESHDILLGKHSDNIKFKKFLFQIFYPNNINPLQNPLNPSESNPELDQYLKKMGFLKDNQTAIDLFDSINSTELKKDWKQYLIDKLKTNEKLLPFISRSEKPKEPGEPEEHQISLDEYIQYDLPSKNLYYKLKNKINELPLTHIFVNINGVSKEIKISKADLDEPTKKCGADNCFKTITHDDGKTYGVRFSKNILFDNSIVLYDTIIEMLINCISYFTLQKLKETQKDIISADIQPLSGMGFYKVKIKDKPIYGYIPYTVYEMKEETITLYDLVKNILNGNPVEYSVVRIKEILGNVCLQIYNFYNIMYPSIKFEHNDFKIDNIVLNPKTLQVYIIDFGLSRINVITENRNYQIFKREVKELERKNDTSNFYFYISDIYEKYYLNKQADIEKLTVWLKEIKEKRDPDHPPFLNKKNYETVIQNSFIPNIRFLEYLSLKDIETSDIISRYKEQELKDQLGFAECQDLFLYTMDEFKKAIDSLLNKPQSRNDSQSKCMYVINSKFPSKSPKAEIARRALASSNAAIKAAANVVANVNVGGARKTKNQNKTKKRKGNKTIKQNKNKTRKHKKN
jgi:hypothetical protein